MLIDWFTMAAQLINFLVLVWLLKRFLYKPVLNAIDTRERQIRERLQQAQSLQTEAAQQRDEFTAKNAELAQQRDVLLREAGSAAQAQREQLLEQARREAATLRTKLTQSWQQDAQTMTLALKQRTQEEVLAVARKALGELADVTLEQRMVDLFIARLRQLDAAQHEHLRDAMHAAAVQVRSAFALDPAQQELVTREIRQLLAPSAQIEFVTAPELLGGVELMADGYKLEWNLAAFVTGMEAWLDAHVLASSAAKP